MTKKEKLDWMRNSGFDVSIIDKNTIRVQKYGFIVTGTILQVYDEVRIFGRHKKKGNQS